MNIKARSKVESTNIAGAHSGRVSVWGISSYYTPIFSGAAVQAQRLYSALTGEEFAFDVLTPHHEQAAMHPTVEILDGVKIHRLHVLPSWSIAQRWLGGLWVLFNKWFFIASCVFVIWKRRKEVDLVHIHGEGGYLPFIAPFMRAIGIPTILKQTMLRSDVEFSGGRLLLVRLNRWATDRADKIVTLSATMTQQLEEAGVAKDKLVEIFQGVDTALFHPVSDQERTALRAKLGLDLSATYIIFVGGVIHRKGIDVLVRAFGEIAQLNTSLRLIVVGPRDFVDHPQPQLGVQYSRYYAALQRELVQHSVADCVVWTGKLPPEDVSSYLQAADIFCLPSRMEGTPSAPLEAMACGLPVVVSSLGGTTAELFAHGQEGFIVESEQSADYAAYLLQLAEDKTLARYVGLMARQRVEQHYSLERATEQYKLLFRDLLRP